MKILKYACIKYYYVYICTVMFHRVVFIFSLIVKLKDGFSCPKDKMHNSRGQNVAHPVFAHPDDCQKFYVCLNGITPREQGCSVGEVFNEESQRCDQPENVRGW